MAIKGSTTSPEVKEKISKSVREGWARRRDFLKKKTVVIGTNRAVAGQMAIELARAIVSVPHARAFGDVSGGFHFAFNEDWFVLKRQAQAVLDTLEGSNGPKAD